MGYVDDIDLEARLLSRLDPTEFGLGWCDPPPVTGDYDLNPHARPATAPILKPAAVLAPIIRRPEGFTILLTRRTNDMPTHAGQVAFPGGRLQAGDDGPVGAALREAQEEVGLDPAFVRPVGALAPYETVTGFTVAPIIALVEPGFTLSPDPREVADIFEIPARVAFNPANHVREEREWRGGKRAFWVIPFEDRFI